MPCEAEYAMFGAFCTSVAGKHRRGDGIGDMPSAPAQGGRNVLELPQMIQLGKMFLCALSTTKRGEEKAVFPWHN
jgi:hypothetical protein